MTVCENTLFIQFDTVEKKDYFLSVFENVENDVLFGSFIELVGTKKECYGTDSDVYIENVTFDISDNDIISILFYTHESPCLEFCKKLAAKYTVNIELVFLNEENNYSGKIHINQVQIVKNEIYSYWQGVYLFRYSVFWESLEELFEKYSSKNFMELLQKASLSLFDKDLQLLQNRFDEFNLFKQFTNYNL